MQNAKYLFRHPAGRGMPAVKSSENPLRIALIVYSLFILFVASGQFLVKKSFIIAKILRLFDGGFFCEFYCYQIIQTLVISASIFPIHNLYKINS